MSIKLGAYRKHTSWWKLDDLRLYSGSIFDMTHDLGPVRAYITRLEAESGVKREELHKHPAVQKIHRKALDIAKNFSKSPELRKTSESVIKDVKSSEQLTISKQQLLIWQKTGPNAIEQEFFTAFLMLHAIQHGSSSS